MLKTQITMLKAQLESAQKLTSEQNRTISQLTQHQTHEAAIQGQRQQFIGSQTQIMRELQEMKQILLENRGVSGVKELIIQLSAKVDNIQQIQQLRHQELSQSQLACNQSDTQSALNEIKAQIQALQSQNVRRTETRQIAPRESEQVKNALDQLLNKINQLQFTKSVNFADEQSLRSTVFRGNASDGALDASASAADQNRISEQINELKQQIADLTQQLVHERLKSSSTQNEQILQKLNQTLERDLKETAARLDQVQNERDSVRLENDQLRAENKELGMKAQKLPELTKLNERLTEQLQQQGQRLDELKDTFQDLRNLVKAQIGQDGPLVDQINELLKTRETALDFERQIADLTQQLAKSEDLRKEMRRRARSERDLRIEADSQLRGYQRKFEAQEAKLKKYREDLEQIRKYALEYTSMVAAELDKLENAEPPK